MTNDSTLKVVYEDENFYVIDKPYGMSVNKSKTTRYQVTVQDIVEQNPDFIKLLKEYEASKVPEVAEASVVSQIAGSTVVSESTEAAEPDDKTDTASSVDPIEASPEILEAESVIEPEAAPELDATELSIKAFYDRAGIVHRIDKDTSGLLLIAKNPETFILLQKIFADREIKKEYIALVYGHFADMVKGELFEVDAPIARSNKNRERFAVDALGKEAKTIFKIEEILTDKDSGDEYTLLTCYPQTGRTHQIRVHITILGHPILGDKLYSGKKRYKTNKDTLDRQFLHASCLKFQHPITNEEVVVKSELPSDLKAVLDSLY